MPWHRSELKDTCLKRMCGFGAGKYEGLLEYDYENFAGQYLCLERWDCEAVGRCPAEKALNT